MGQATGAIASLPVRNDISPENVALAKVHALLKEHGAIVPVTKR